MSIITNVGNGNCVTELTSCSLLAYILFFPDDGGTVFLRNDSKLLLDYMASRPRGQTVLFTINSRRSLDKKAKFYTPLKHVTDPNNNNNNNNNKAGKGKAIPLIGREGP
jgi:hypothetical protein